MTPAQQRVNVTGSDKTDPAVHLLLTEGDVNIMAQSPEQVMAEIEIRATQVSALLEGIFQEPHGRPDWGIND